MRFVTRLLGALLVTCAAHAQQPPIWSVCTEMLPGVRGARPWYRDCRPLPVACRATPTCACMARAMPDPFRYACRRVGRRFIRRMIPMP